MPHKLRLWNDNRDNPHYIKTISLSSIPRVGERVVDEKSRHFKVNKVMHIAVQKPGILSINRKRKPKSYTDLWVVEY